MLYSCLTHKIKHSSTITLQLACRCLYFLMFFVFYTVHINFCCLHILGRRKYRSFAVLISKIMHLKSLDTDSVTVSEFSNNNYDKRPFEAGIVLAVAQTGGVACLREGNYTHSCRPSNNDQI